MSFVWSFELSVKHTYLFAANLAYGNYNFPFSTFKLRSLSGIKQMLFSINIPYRV